MNQNGSNDLHDFFKRQLGSSEHVGRVTHLAHGIYTVRTAEGSYKGSLSGRFYHQVESSRDLPAVGDWVVFDPYENNEKALIQRVLERRTLLSRKQAGQSNDEQIIAANIDVVFIVTALTQEFNVRRLERYVMQVYQSGARPVIVCTKQDLCDDTDDKIAQVHGIAPGVPVYSLNNLSGEGVEELQQELNWGETISMIGSSGVGKSTLINRLLGEDVQETREVRLEDDRGRHTTTHRELFQLPDGTFIIDTPGMRELQLWGDEDSVDTTFSDIEDLSAFCKFRDCKHDREPGCSVQLAIEEGRLSADRLKSYYKLKREVRRLELKDQYGAHRTNRMLHGPNSIQ